MPLPVLTGLYAHYEADTLGLANGATVTTWPDLSGNGNDLAQTGGVPLPTYATNSLNGMGGVVFDATHQRIADVSVSTGSAARTVFAVVKNPANNGTIRYLTLQTNLTIAKWSNADRWIFGNSSGGGQFIEFTETGLENATGQWTYVHQQTGAVVRWNQVQKVSGNIGAPAADTDITLGVSDANVSMIVYEWAIYDGVVSGGDIDLNEDYLFNKWFVSSQTLAGILYPRDGLFPAGSVSSIAPPTPASGGNRMGGNRAIRKPPRR